MAGLLIVLSAAATDVVAQTGAAAPSTFDADLIRDLPTSDNLYQLLDASEATLIADRFFGGGLYSGQAGRIGGFLGSWTQTLFRVEDVDLTDPTGSGAPILVPDLFLWNAVRATTRMPAANLNAAGLAISLDPRRHERVWTRTIQATTSHFGSTPASDVPAIARIDGWDHITALVSGPVVADRLGLVAAGSWTSGSQFDRADPASTSSSIVSGFGHLVFTPTGRDEIRTIGWLRRASTPFELRRPVGQADAAETQTAFHVQSTWERRDPNARPWRAFAGYSRRDRRADWDRTATIPVLERLSDGPMSLMTEAADAIVHQWSLGARVAGSPPSARSRHAIEAGVDARGGGARASSFFSGVAGELVDGGPARVWRFANPGLESFRHAIGAAAFVSDRLTMTPRIVVDGGVRYDSVSGKADGASQGVSWNTLLPRAAVRWTLAGNWQPTFVAGFSRTAYRLPLDWLAFGDPAAPYADVFRWNAFSGSPSTVTTIGPLVARVGPGTGGDPDFSGIDAELKRPLADEIVAGVEVRPADGLRFELTGVARRERDLPGILNVGTPQYVVSGVLDPGANVGAIEDDRLVPVYNRRIESFGLDRYVLANGPQQAATFNGVVIAADLTRPRFLLRLGATAGRAVATAANIGFGPLENDQGLSGDIAADPNAATFARGRTFNDRAYTAKVTAVYRFPKATTLGMIARYQDGQPFARLLVDRGLNQGAEAIRAFANGDSRFTFTGTLDARLQKRFLAGSRAVDVVADVYNLIGLSNSVEEKTTAAPDVRTSTAVQPPFTLHLGLRLVF
jgi:hypothetical protein